MKKPVPTIKEIAKRLNISVSTVSRALHNHHSIGLRTKMRVQQLAEELKYEPNQTAIFFKQRKTFTIGVIMPGLSESFFRLLSVVLRIWPVPKIIMCLSANPTTTRNGKNN